MDTLKKAELTASICHVVKSGVLIYNFEVPETAGRKQEEEEHM